MLPHFWVKLGPLVRVEDDEKGKQCFRDSTGDIPLGKTVSVSQDTVSIRITLHLKYKLMKTVTTAQTSGISTVPHVVPTQSIQKHQK
jgi:hypothetical protein